MSIIGPPFKLLLVLLKVGGKGPVAKRMWIPNKGSDIDV